MGVVTTIHPSNLPHPAHTQTHPPTHPNTEDDAARASLVTQAAAGAAALPLAIDDLEAAVTGVAVEAPVLETPRGGGGLRRSLTGAAMSIRDLAGAAGKPNKVGGVCVWGGIGGDGRGECVCMEGGREGWVGWVGGCG